jgi:hypothetical protein
VRRSSVTVPGRAGRSYVVRVRAVDRAGNTGRSVSARVTVPRDDRALRLRGPWRRTRSRSAWRGTLASCRSACSLRVRFRGREAALIGPRPVRAVRLVVRLDGRRRVLRVRGGERARARRVLAVVRAARGGRHTLSVRGRLVVDALGTR